MGPPGTLRTAAELIDYEPPPINWTVEGLIPAGGTALLVGSPKAGKSTFARNLCIAVARGMNFVGRDCHKGPTLYASFEGRFPGIRQHLLDMGVKRDDAFMHYHGLQPIEKPTEWLDGVMTKHKPALVVLDTLQRFLRIEDLNSYSAVSNAMQDVIGLAEYHECAIVGIHHRRKSGGERGEEASGSAVLLGSVDTGIYFREDGEQRSIYSRQREGHDLPETALNLHGDGWTALGPTVGAIKREDLERNINAALVRVGEPLTKEEIAKLVEGRAGQVLSALTSMVAKGTATQTGKGAKGDPKRYAAP